MRDDLLVMLRESLDILLSREREKSGMLARRCYGKPSLFVERILDQSPLVLPATKVPSVNPLVIMPNADQWSCACPNV